MLGSTVISHGKVDDRANSMLVELARAMDHRILELILLPTEDCNFRCVYCYEDFSIGKMPDHIIRGVKAHIRRRAPRLRQLVLNWFGGEPLIALDVVDSISDEALTLSQKYGFNYHGSMTTNGALLDVDVAKRLYHIGIRQYQISLDGWGDVHDQTRRRRNGKGSFKKIWSNLIAINEECKKYIRDS